MKAIKESLSRIKQLTIKEFKQLFRDKSNLLLGIGLPIILIFIFGYGISFDINNEELKQNLEEVMSFNGSRAEKLLMTFCMQTKIKYDKLSEEEKQWLIRIVQKSELLKSYIPRRGKRV